jgi:hypothetical protein
MNFMRTFLQASLPAWLILAILLFFSQGNLSGYIGLLFVLVLLYPGIWGALQLQQPTGGWSRRLSIYVFFGLALGMGITIILMVILIALHTLGLYRGEVEINNLVGKSLLFGVISSTTFLVMRGMIALAGVARLWGWRGCLVRGAGLMAILAAIGVGGYWWVTRPYVGHSSWTEPRIQKTTVLSDFDQGSDGWQAADPSVRLLVENSALHLAAVAPTLFYTVTWQVQSNASTSADGLRVRARSDASTTLEVEVQERGGSKFRSWVDLPGGDWKSQYLTDFLPSLDSLNENYRLEWEKVVRLTFYVYLENSGAGVWLDKIEAVTLDHSHEKPWLEAISEHFWIRYHASDQSALTDVQKSAEDPFDHITTFLGYRPGGRVPITIVSSHAELEQQVGGARPTWVHGTALPDSLAILTPLRFSPTFNGHRYEEVFKLVPHEFTHLLLAQIVGYPGFLEMPSWLNEGLAVYLAGQSWDEQALKDAAKQRKLPSLEELGKAFSSQEPAGASYSIARSITGFLIETYGADKIPLLLGALAKGRDFNSALQETIGIDRETLERQWREMLVNR